MQALADNKPAPACSRVALRQGSRWSFRFSSRKVDACTAFSAFRRPPMAGSGCERTFLLSRAICANARSDSRISELPAFPKSPRPAARRWWRPPCRSPACPREFLPASALSEQRIKSLQRLRFAAALPAPAIPFSLQSFPGRVAAASTRSQSSPVTFDPRVFSALRRVFEKQVRRAMRRNNPSLIRHSQLPCSVFAACSICFPIGRGAHDNSHHRLTSNFSLRNILSCAERFVRHFSTPTKQNAGRMAGNVRKEAPFYGLSYRDATFPRSFHARRNSPTRYSEPVTNDRVFAAWPSPARIPAPAPHPRSQ